jgi:hypothetical protein
MTKECEVENEFISMNETGERKTASFQQMMMNQFPANVY